MAVTKRRTYSDNDKALIFAELEMSEGNIRRTSRNLNIPISTVRYFKQQWETEGVPKEIAEAIPTVVQEFVDDAERVRDKLLIALEQKVDSRDINAREIVTALGVLTDKIRAMRGLDARKVEHSISLPDAEEMRSLFQGVISEVVGAAQTRNDELEDAEIVEGTWEPASTQAALPRAPNTEGS
jgi:transposase-like protein